MAKLTKRIEALEALNRPGEGNPLAGMPLPEFMAHIEKVLDLEPDCLPRTPEDAAARGFESMADALAHALDMTGAELKRYLQISEGA